MKELHATIEGKVQGVFFRQTTRKRAKALGVVGWVKNKKDGSVEVVGQGHEENIKNFIDFLHEGPRRAHVKNVDVEWREPTEEFDTFAITYS